MTAQIARRVPARLAAVAAALLLVMGFVALWAQPASAHDELLGTDPAADSTLDALPAQVTLSFSAALIADAGGTAVQVTDAAGTSLTAGDPLVSENTVTQPLAGTASGPITVVWRVVSSDGHPISDKFAFTVTGAAEPTPSASASPSASAEPTQESTPEPTMTILSAGPTESESADPLPWVIGGIVLLVAIVVVVALLLARARQQRGSADGRTESRDDPTGR